MKKGTTPYEKRFKDLLVLNEAVVNLCDVIHRGKNQNPALHLLIIDEYVRMKIGRIPLPDRTGGGGVGRGVGRGGSGGGGKGVAADPVG